MHLASVTSNLVMYGTLRYVTFFYARMWGSFAAGEETLNEAAEVVIWR
jgi:hypothetical protein